MRHFALCFCLLLSALTATSQKEIIARTTWFIKDGHYAKADAYLDSILKRNPKNVDALVMKGNVLLNYSWQHTSKNYFDLEKAESVFSDALIDQSFFTPIIPLDTSKLIESIWKKALAIDSTRQDILKGLCNLYSLSLRIDDLTQQLKRMKKLITKSDESAFTYAEYARNVKDRGHFDDGMKIYRVIADMFPQLAGIRCDMAGEYFYAGKSETARNYLDSTLAKPDIDQTSFINAAGIYSALGFYNNAYITFNRYSRLDTVIVDRFYKGLMMFAFMDTGYRMQLVDFVKTATENNYSDELSVARQLLPFADRPFTFDDFMKLADDNGIPDYYKAPIYQRALSQFSDSCQPSVLYGIFECRFKNYDYANRYLRKCEFCDTLLSDYPLWELYYGYDLAMLGNKEGAQKRFNGLLNAMNDFIRQAAVYFMAKYLLQDGKKEEANKLFEKIVAEPVKTKYGQLAQNYLAGK
ncbi:MAG TPA: hypothetical protein VG603_07510 [Chitinophagales bacterium]|nr:hypothetical protein [Chitinophagales bacterium]